MSYADHTVRKDARDQIDASPLTYARQLSTYIRDPKKIETLTRAYFGHSPSIRHISAMVEKNAPPRTKAAEPDGDIECLLQPEPVRVVQLVKSDAIRSPVTPAEIIDAIARHFKLTGADIVGPRRKVPIVRVRNLCAYVLRQRGNSYPQVGKMLGGRDHSTIIHACRNFEERARPIEREIAARYRKRPNAARAA